MWFRDGNMNSEPVEEAVNSTSPIFPELPRLPGIYKLVKVEGSLQIVYESNIIKTDDIIFGDVGKRVLREWSRFVRHPYTLGSLNLGDQGGGKSNKCDILANIAVLKGKLPVLKVTGFSISEKEVQFFQTLNHCCIYFDEYGKTVNWQVQQKMLSMLTNKNKKIFVLYTENNKSLINEFILDRTERAFYLEEFNKIDEKAVLDYMSLFGVDEKFKEEFLVRYRKALTFSFDNLKAIVSEHLDYPEDNIDDILKYLNVSALKIKLSYNATKIEQIKITEEGRTLEPLDINKLRNRTLTINNLKDGMAVEYNEDWFRISTDNVVSSLGGTIIVEKNSYRITYVEG